MEHIGVIREAFDNSGVTGIDNIVAKGKIKKKRITEIMVTRANEPPIGLIEKSLAQIYVRKINNGVFNI